MRAPRGEHLVVLARRAEPGAAKTRLIPLLGPRGAARLHAELLAGTLEAARRFARRAGRSAELRLTGTPSDGPWAPRGWRHATGEQGPGDLGARLGRALEAAFARGARRVLAIGSDCPDLGPRHLEAAARALDGADLVLGPARDGGYWLLGLRRPVPALWTGMPWGGGDLLARTLAAARAAGLRVARLETLGDLDTPADLTAWARGRLAPGPAPPWLSVVLPTLNEEEELAAALLSALREPGIEVVVADGGSRDRTPDIARALGARVVEESASRGRQLNAGARAARAATLLFLHADTRLPPGYGRRLRRVLGWRGTAAGAFELGIDGPGLALRLVETGVALRSRLLGRPYGDQALFLAAATLRAAGGFPDLPRLEDVGLLRRLAPLGAVRLARGRVRTSDRRWRRHGVWRTTLAHQRLLLGR